MTYIRVDKDHPLPKPTRIWGVGPIIGDCQKSIVQDSDYEDVELIQEAIRDAFDQNDNLKEQ